MFIKSVIHHLSTQSGIDCEPMLDESICFFHELWSYIRNEQNDSAKKVILLGSFNVLV